MFILDILAPIIHVVGLCDHEVLDSRYVEMYLMSEDAADR